MVIEKEEGGGWLHGYIDEIPNSEVFEPENLFTSIYIAHAVGKTDGAMSHNECSLLG